MNHLLLGEIVTNALREDVGWADITTEAVVPPDSEAVGIIHAKAPGVIAGLPVVQAVYEVLDGDVLVQALVEEGERVDAGRDIARIEGNTRSILTGERVALNFLQRLSGIATATRTLVEAVAPYGTRVVDTRKTTPGLRLLEKYAVRVGGGVNHRFGLDDAVLLKENHLTAAGGVTAAVTRAQEALGHMVVIEVEVTDLDEVREAVDVGADVILLDNMDADTMARAVAIIDGRATVEASGGITAETAVEVARAGVDVMSAGYLTHSIKSMDLSLNIRQT